MCIYTCVCMFKENLALNYLQVLTCRETKPTKIGVRTRGMECPVVIELNNHELLIKLATRYTTWNGCIPDTYQWGIGKLSVLASYWYVHLTKKQNKKKQFQNIITNSENFSMLLFFDIFSIGGIIYIFWPLNTTGFFKRFCFLLSFFA